MRVPLVPSARTAALLLAVVMLGACTARDGGAAKQPYTPADFAPTVYCPPVEIRAGTEALTTYERGHDNDPAYARSQASITRTARECRAGGEGMSIKLGVSGRVVAGPKGGPGTVTLPIRVAVVRQVGGGGPLFTQLYKVPVTLTPGNLGTNYDQVFEQINVPVGPQERNLLIYVGFDEGA